MTHHEKDSGHQTRFYTQRHKRYCGIDLHARMMYLFIMDAVSAHPLKSAF